MGRSDIITRFADEFAVASDDAARVVDEYGEGAARSLVRNSDQVQPGAMEDIVAAARRGDPAPSVMDDMVEGGTGGGTALDDMSGSRASSGGDAPSVREVALGSTPRQATTAALAAGAGYGLYDYGTDREQRQQTEAAARAEQSDSQLGQSLMEAAQQHRQQLQQQGLSEEEIQQRMNEWWANREGLQQEVQQDAAESDDGDGGGGGGSFFDNIFQDPMKMIFVLIITIVVLQMVMQQSGGGGLRGYMA